MNTNEIRKANKSLEARFQEVPFVGSSGMIFYGPRLDKNGLTLNGIWVYLNEIKEQAVKVIPEEQWLEIKQECDDLFRQASGGKFTVCPAWMFSIAYWE